MPKKIIKINPSIHPSAFIAEGVQLMGAVTVGAFSSIWYNSVLRGDINSIEIGARTNIQDNSVLHVENDRRCIVGSDVTVGHRALLHGCTIEDGCLIGMGAIVLNGAVLKRGCIIGAGALIKENTVVESGTLWVGVPAKQVKEGLTSIFDNNIKWASKYVQLAEMHKNKAF